MTESCGEERHFVILGEILGQHVIEHQSKGGAGDTIFLGLVDSLSLLDLVYHVIFVVRIAVEMLGEYFSLGVGVKRC